MDDPASVAELWADVCATVAILRTHSTAAQVADALGRRGNRDIYGRFNGHEDWGTIKLWMFRWLCESELPQRRAA